MSGGCPPQEVGADAAPRCRDVVGEREAMVASGSVGSVLGKSFDRYLDLYEFAPFGYLTLSADGLIEEVNVTATRLFACPKNVLLCQRFAAFVVEAQRDTWLGYWQYVSRGERPAAIEVALRRGGGGVFHALLAAVPATSGVGKALPTRAVRLAIADISDRQRIAEAFRVTESRERALLDNFPFAVWLKDTESRFLAVNSEFARLFGAASPSELIGKDDYAIVPADLAERYRADAREVLASREKICREEQLESAGRREWFETYKAPVIGADGVLFGTVGFARNIERRRQSEEQLRLAASVFTHARESIMILATSGTIIDVNEAFVHLTGFARDEVVGRPLRYLESDRHDRARYAAIWRALRSKGHWYGEIWNRRKSGEAYAAMLTISAVRDAQGASQQYVALLLDITQMKAHEKQLEHLAHYDALTSLPNRVLLADRLHQAMTQALRHRRPLAVTYLDIDGFKTINDRYGHDVGDRLLIAVTERMKRVLREGDTLARFGGDEFIAVLPDVADVAACVPLLGRLLLAAAQPIAIGEISLQVSASLGVTFFPQDREVDANQLLQQADQAMYRAKQGGRNRFHVFDGQADTQVRSQLHGVERVAQAFASGEFVLHYQPKVSLRSGRVIGLEALLRWQHPQDGLLLPGAFLPLIEDHQIAVDLGEWVIDAALAQMDAWRDAGLALPVSVNVGARQLLQSGFVDRLRALLEAHPRVAAADLELEVLEGCALEDLARVSQVIEACRDIGVLFVLDDFGAGYSSLTYLKRLMVAKVKIDQNFVRDMLDDPDDLVLLQGVLGLATAFHRQVIAEGVETVEHGEMLLQLGFELAQGYGIARPMPAEDVASWVVAWQLDPAWADYTALDAADLPVLFARVEHRAWVVAAVSFLKGERNSPPPTDIHACRFGIWLDTQGVRRYAAHRAFARIDQAHRQAHAVFDELLRLHARGEADSALARLRELDAWRDILLDELKALTRSAHRPLQAAGSVKLG